MRATPRGQRALLVPLEPTMRRKKSKGNDSFEDLDAEMLGVG